MRSPAVLFFALALAFLMSACGEECPSLLTIPSDCVSSPFPCGHCDHPGQECRSFENTVQCGDDHAWHCLESANNCTEGVDMGLLYPQLDMTTHD